MSQDERRGGWAEAGGREGLREGGGRRKMRYVEV